MNKIFLVLLILFSDHVIAETVTSDLYNKNLFLEARQQILLMQEKELDEFRDYLSSCGTHWGGEIKRFFCERSARAYILKYGQGKAVEKLILAMAEIELLVDMVDEADEKGQVDEAAKIQVFKDLDRYVVIRQMMETAMKETYAEILREH